MLDAPTYDYLVQLMFMAKANDNLELKELISYPHLKKEDMGALNKRLSLQSTSESMRAAKAVTADQLESLGISTPSDKDYKKYLDDGGKKIKKKW